MSKLTQRPELHSGIYAITDPGLTMVQAGFPGTPGLDDVRWHREAIARTTAAVVEVCDAGVRVIQIRWKNVDAGYFLELATAISNAVDKNVQLIINDRIDVYLAAVGRGARLDGVHVGQTDLPVSDVRQMIGGAALLGLSAALDDEVEHANKIHYQLDSIGVGPVRATATKAINRDDVEIGGIARRVRHSCLPVTAIGGIVADDVEPLVNTGVHSIAVISAIFSAPNPAKAAKEFVERWDNLH